MVGAILVTQMNDARKNSTDLMWDGRLCRSVFQLIQMIEYMLDNTAGQTKCNDKLEMAILYFLRAFKKSYFMDNGSSNTISNSLTFSSSISPAAHPLLSLALSSSSPAATEDAKEEATTVCDI